MAKDRTAADLLNQMARVSVVMAIAGVAVLGAGIYVGLVLHGTMSDASWVMATVVLLVLGSFSAGLALVLRHLATRRWRDQLRPR